MMDHATQTNIKQARDMLVGKIPSPIDQCHEITKALIYKFISDNDRESLTLGGEPFYFPDTAAEYRWDNLMERRQTADDMRRLYHAGLEYIGNRNALIVRVLLYVFLLQERNYIMIEVYTVACGVMVYRL